MDEIPPNPGVETKKTKHDDDKPWWNSADKMGGIMATAICILIFVIVAILLIGWALHLVS